MRKLLIASIVLGLLPITSAPANANKTCSHKVVRAKNGGYPKTVFLGCKSWNGAKR